MRSISIVTIEYNCFNFNNFIVLFFAGFHCVLFYHLFLVKTNTEYPYLDK
jgi:hypothetical protein